MFENGINSERIVATESILPLQAQIRYRISTIPAQMPSPENPSTRLPETENLIFGVEGADKEKKPRSSDVAKQSLVEKAASESSQFSIPIVGIEPRYPLLLLSKSIKGSVTASFQVGENGMFENIQILESIPAGKFDDAVIEAISAARIKEGSMPLKKELKITVTFDPAGIGSPPSLSIRP